MNIQEILDEQFPTHEAAITKYGSNELLITMTSPLKLQPPIADLELDMFMEQARPINKSIVKLRLEQFYDPITLVRWWQFINIGEV